MLNPFTIDPAGTVVGPNDVITGAVPPVTGTETPPVMLKVFTALGGIPAGPVGVETTTKRGPLTAVVGIFTVTVTTLPLNEGVPTIMLESGIGDPWFEGR